jgi:hypothetical protein
VSASIWRIIRPCLPDAGTWPLPNFDHYAIPMSAWQLWSDYLQIVSSWSTSHKHHVFKTGEVMYYSTCCWQTSKSWLHCSPFLVMVMDACLSAWLLLLLITGLAKQQNWHFIQVFRPGILLSPSQLRSSNTDALPTNYSRTCVVSRASEQGLVCSEPTNYSKSNTTCSLALRFPEYFPYWFSSKVQRPTTSGAEK